MTRRVLHVITGFDAAGAERALGRVVGRMSPDRWQNLVLGLGPDGPAAEALRDHGVETVALGARSVLGSVRLGVRLAQAARGFRPELVHGWMYHGNLAATWAATATGPRPALIWGIRQGLYDLEQSPAGTRAAIRLGALFSSVPARILYNSAEAARQHERAGYRAAGTRIVRNGFDADAFERDADLRPRVRAALGLDRSDEVVILPARWHPVKDHGAFARAAGRLAARRPRARFLLCGHGIDEKNDELVRMLEREGARDRCLLLGERTDLADLFQAADLATLSSRGEAFPNALGEAMAAGLPCVGPAVGDVVDLIGDTGIVVPASDPDALAAGWEAVLSLDRSRRLDMGQSARERIRRRFSLDLAVAALEAVYHEVLGV